MIGNNGEKGFVSYLNERTVEHLLISELVDILSCHFSQVIPFYFWKSREGGYLNRESLGNTSFRVIAVYPRRPKVNRKKEGKILFTINQRIAERANFLLSRQIPVFTGTPLISSLVDIGKPMTFYWCRLIKDISDSFFIVDGVHPETLSHPSVEGNSKFAFVPDIKTNSASINWTSFLGILEELRYIVPWMSVFGGQYKPMYFLLFD